MELQKEIAQKTAAMPHGAGRLAQLLFRYPIMDARDAQKHLKVSFDTAAVAASIDLIATSPFSMLVGRQEKRA